MNQFQQILSAKAKFIFLFVVVFLFANETKTCQAQDTAKVNFKIKNVIKINPWGIPWGSMTLSYERFIKPRNALEVFLNYKYNTSDAFFLNYNDYPEMKYKITGFMFLCEYRRYFYSKKRDNQIDGFYLSPFFRYSHIDFKDWYYGALLFDVPINSYKFGITAGFQKAIKKKIIIDLFIGPHFQFIYNENLGWYNMPWENSTGKWYLGLRFGINFGFAF